jgi:hypothetical protein
MGGEENGLTLQGLAQRLEALERENAELRHEVAALRGSEDTHHHEEELAGIRGFETRPYEEEEELAELSTTAAVSHGR